MTVQLKNTKSCTQCGEPLNRADRFCFKCGTTIKTYQSHKGSSKIKALLIVIILGLFFLFIEFLDSISDDSTSPFGHPDRDNEIAIKETPDFMEVLLSIHDSQIESYKKYERYFPLDTLIKDGLIIPKSKYFTYTIDNLTDSTYTANAIVKDNVDPLISGQYATIDQSSTRECRGGFCDMEEQWDNTSDDEESDDY